MAIKIDLEKAYDKDPNIEIQTGKKHSSKMSLTPYLRILNWPGELKFCTSSGHIINARKINILFSSGVEEELRDSIGGVLGFQRVANLGTYLGVPLFHDRVTNSSLRFVVYKVRAKLQCWDVKQLSIVGRVTLPQSILLLIPSYFM
ncbi:Retrovirus-related Pol polyprotein LINE-1 [Gossypium australe]|uniref:Retrovirus-related Pol polyprotein LINE-1 n=1 Tax=Gossypium australe TaxID=47621 RepID=A0A5B6WI60_9ROSI|nr:Retrovirus-related Pol polyprotein LINE-1 [Gossypium australe]